MGHRFSKTAANNIAAVKTRTNKANEQQKQQLQAFNTITRTTNIIPIPSGSQQQQQQQFLGPTFNLQIHESSNITCSSTGNCDSGARTASINSLTTAAAILQKPQPHQQLQQQQQQQYNTNSISSSSLNSINNLSCSGGRQIIIKIQLAKMENGNETSTATTTPLMVAEHLKNTSLENIKTDCNLNSTEPLTLSSSSSSLSSTMAPINFNLNSSNNSTSTNIISSDSNNCMSMPNPGVVPTKITATGLTSLTSSSTLSPPTTSVFCRTAGSSTNQNNNIYLNANLNGNSSSSITATRLERPERLQFNDEIFEQNIGEIVEYCEVLEPQQQPSTALAATPTININNMQMLTISEETDNNGANNACCRRKSKSLAANGNGSSTASFSSSSSNNNNNTGTKTKNRCRKCSCRDALRRFLDPSLSRSSSTSNKAGKQQQQKEQKRNKSQDRHSTASTNTSNQLFNNNNSIHSNMTTTNNASTPGTTTSATAAVVMPPVATNQVSLWAPATTTNGNDVVIPLTTTPAALPPQFVVVQCAIVNSSNSLPPAPTASTLSFNSNSSSTLTNNNNALISTIPNDLSPTTSSTSTINEFKNPSNSTNIGGPTVHSQVDFVHYLVPDLERIMNSSFYWGKMDRYEAERLLEGKPEGTFLLRDSAQEEFLFSVTFRKYGRSLHARIEQSGHRFSFDCHDPCVFTAPTVTGLLEHYKDPACVMFFEPMLTIPLHRKNCFSLQKLCRATIVSNTTYDGINELELPARLKAYLKEYHYKQKLRVKFNEPTYTIHFK